MPDGIHCVWQWPLNDRMCQKRAVMFFATFKFEHLSRLPCRCQLSWNMNTNLLQPLLSTAIFISSEVNKHTKWLQFSFPIVVKWHFDIATILKPVCLECTVCWLNAYIRIYLWIFISVRSVTFIELGGEERQWTIFVCIIMKNS